MKTITFIFACLLLPFTLLGQPKVITVDNRPNTGANYTSLASAVSAATVGDTIYIHPSATSYGNVIINIPLILVGLSHNPLNSKSGEKATVGNITFGGASANSLVTGLQLNLVNVTTQTNVSGIRIVNNRINVYIIGSNNANGDDWIIEGNIFTNTYIQPGVNTNGWIIKNNIFDQTTQYPLYNCNDQISFLNNIVISSSGNFANNCTNTLVNNNIFILEASIVNVNLSSSTIVFNNNLTRNTSGFTVTALSGSGNLDNINPGFINAPYGTIGDYYNNDYNVTGAALTAATDGGPLGVFGASNFPFDAQGRPDLWPYMTSLDISNSSVPQGQNINVTFTAEKKN